MMRSLSCCLDATWQRAVSRRDRAVVSRPAGAVVSSPLGSVQWHSMPSAPMRAPAAPNTEYSRQIMSQNHGCGRAGDEFDEKIVIVRGAHTTNAETNAEIMGPLIPGALSVLAAD